MKTNWTTRDIPSQQGRRVLITGANSGIGFHTALELARQGAEIILPARSLAKSEDAIARIRAEVPNAKLIAETLDLADLSSVHAFAARIVLRFPGQSLDLLINNAGVMAIPQREITPDGYERQFATNYLGPFALTALLYNSIRQQLGSRIVIVSSTASKFGKIDFSNLQSERRYSPMWQCYAQSKLADSIFALELQRRLTAINSPIITTAAHPGYAITNLQTSGPGEGSFMMNLMSMVLKPILSHDALHGALPTLYAAVDPNAQPSGYYGPNGFQELKGNPAPAKIAPAAQDPIVAAKLWAVSEQLTGVPFNIHA
ncbi:SDR family NAD(P)-dependent oxidoreductase [Granulicella sp. 5B5]|uniref:oxidoreductase n=1 Tax=Granulicella sp. 5B5 TaxID=1617967 RepID=UPI0015F4EEA0|nr:oxidoreductase [Granulicella sp. 5B5]QMV19935.1 SDR family NAD(P)-dependent oxidoreductase [Granulicella sp. 5B5]